MRDDLARSGVLRASVLLLDFENVHTAQIGPARPAEQRRVLTVG